MGESYLFYMDGWRVRTLCDWGKLPARGYVETEEADAIIPLLIPLGKDLMNRWAIQGTQPRGPARVFPAPPGRGKASSNTQGKRRPKQGNGGAGF